MPAIAPNGRSYVKLACRDKSLDLSTPVVMGVLNVTPDSFSDGGSYLAVGKAVARAHEMVAEGAAIIDVGGESTRPGAQPVSETEELRRVIPVIEQLARLPVIISVDTSKPAVMRAACAAGATLVNDVRALREPGAVACVRTIGAAVCLMHMQGEPQTMQQAPHYDDVVAEVSDFLRGRRDACIAGGIREDRILLDPGFGFGKSLEHNLRLLGALGRLADLGAPLLIGVSRKSMLGAVAGNSGDRLYAGLAAAAIAAWQGARVIRTHDVRQTVEVLRTAAAAIRHRA